MGKSVLWVTLLGLVLLGSAGVHGASVRSLSIHDLSERADSIFEGRVIGSRVVEDANQRLIRTLVTFEIIDPIKGEGAVKTVELSFLGGEIGGRGLRVSNQMIPRSGERGIYFLENLQQRKINPFLGWAQGHFLVTHDPVMKRQGVQTRSGLPVYELLEKEKTPPAVSLSEGIARGVVTEPQLGVSAPLSAEEFKQTIREMIR